ncbi:MAG: excalibur calcium-binding domain-containing protein [Kineosporiaceae bacterium]
MRALVSAGLAAGLAAGLLAGIGLPAEAAAKPVKYKNCTALNKVYKHGVGKPKARDKVASGKKPVTTFTKSLAVYSKNTHLDRDRDGIACEKR